MRSALLFDFIVDKENNALKIQKEFNCSKQMIWDCFTKEELLKEWFAPKPYTIRSRTYNFTEGGSWIYAMVSPEGNEFWALAEFKSIDPIDSYSAKDAFCNEEGEINTALPRSEWDFKFSGTKEQSMIELMIQYESLYDLEKVIEMGMKEGFTMTLNYLDEMIEELKK